MRVSIGTFNLNNLFSRFNFAASVDEVADEEGGIRLEFDSQLGVRVRSFQGRLVKGKDPADTQTLAERANRRRRRQAEMIAEVIAGAERPDSSYVLLGDMNDAHDSEYLQPMLTVENQHLVNGLANPQETRLPKTESQGPGPQTSAWTYRRNPSGPAPPEYTLIDQIWLSPRLASRQIEAFIDRRTLHSGNGSDHDPAWVGLEF